MALPTLPIREEHKGLLPHIENLKRVAAAVKDGSDDAVAAVEEVYTFLSGHLLVHAGAEEAVLYPTVEKISGMPGLTKTMSRDHVAIQEMVEELGHVKSDVAAHSEPVCRLLYGLYALVKVHFEKEEEIYLEMMDAKMNEQEVAEMYAQMEKAAHDLMMKS